jgi:hypothetical protein
LLCNSADLPLIADFFPLFLGFFSSVPRGSGICPFYRQHQLLTSKGSGGFRGEIGCSAENSGGAGESNRGIPVSVFGRTQAG